ncbi:MAG: hypothetical protein RRB13_12630 [bacterium]|nr:hypothetical protein [bacterium]
MAYELIPSDPSIPWVVFNHPEHPKAIRFDLASNGLLGLVVVVSERLYSLGDLSVGGCSYIQDIPTNKFMSFAQVEEWVNHQADGFIGRQLGLKFFFETQPKKGGVLVDGTMKNFRLFLLLSVEEVEREITKYFFARGIKRKHDPKNVFGKLDVMIMKTMGTRNHAKLHHQAMMAFNISFISLLLESAATDEEIREIYRGYSNKRLCIKYGVEFTDPTETKTLLNFAHPKALFEKPPAPKAEAPEPDPSVKNEASSQEPPGDKAERA